MIRDPQAGGALINCTLETPVLDVCVFVPKQGVQARLPRTFARSKVRSQSLGGRPSFALPRGVGRGSSHKEE